jgi:hypothetical protein
MSLSGTTDVQNEQNGLPPWAIAVIAISIVLVTVIVVVVIILVTRNNARKRAVREARDANKRQMGI